MEATLHTNLGDIRLALFAEQAPETVSNFVGLAHLASNARNFLHVVAHYSEHDVSGTVSVRGITAHVHTSDDRQVGIGAFPIAIDPTPFLVDVDKAEVRSELANPEQNN